MTTKFTFLTIFVVLQKQFCKKKKKELSYALENFFFFT